MGLFIPISYGIVLVGEIQNMQKIKCPKCGEVFTIDQSSYDEIVKQIRNGEFEEEVHQKLHDVEEKYNLKLQTKELEFKNQSENENKKLQEKINDLENQIKSFELIKDKALSELKLQNQKELTEKDSLVSKLENEKKVIEQTLKLQEAQYNEKLATFEKNKKTEIDYINKQNDEKIKDYTEQIQLLKDMKSKLSTKMVGESLEQHCMMEFTRLRPLFPNCYFDKDNDTPNGSKGDFIFRDYLPGSKDEYISIMFEMKNEMETTATKHKNEDFFKELDKDRREKKCEYAVLVSLLESDSDLYNSGIVDVSYAYEKMYVVRPQCFIPIITLLRNAALKNSELKQQLMLEQAKNIDVTNFEGKLNNIKNSWANHYDNALKKHQAAIDEIDKAIKKLEDVKTSLLSSDRYINLSNKDMDDLTVRSLTYNNPTMKQLFAEEKKKDEN